MQKVFELTRIKITPFTGAVSPNDEVQCFGRHLNVYVARNEDVVKADRIEQERWVTLVARNELVFTAINQQMGMVRHKRIDIDNLDADTNHRLDVERLVYIPSRNAIYTPSGMLIFRTAYGCLASAQVAFKDLKAVLAKYEITSRYADPYLLKDQLRHVEVKNISLHVDGKPCGMIRKYINAKKHVHVNGVDLAYENMVHAPILFRDTQCTFIGTTIDKISSKKHKTRKLVCGCPYAQPETFYITTKRRPRDLSKGQLTLTVTE